MAKLVFALKYVDEAEANDIRALLTEHDIAFYETTAGRWQISLAALWVVNNEDFVRARSLINQEQAQRQAQQQAQGNKRSFWHGLLVHCWQNPVACVFTLLALVFIVALSILPFKLFA